MNKNGCRPAFLMHFCPLRCFRDLTRFIRKTGSMAWNLTFKQRLQLQVTNQRGIPPLETFPINQHGSSSPNTGAYSNTMLQGRSLKDSRNLSEKTSRKSLMAKKALLIACGVRCVLSPRPSNCSTSSPNKDEKDRPRSTPARGETCNSERVDREMEGWSVYSGIRRIEDRERARSSIQRERVKVDLTNRPSTVPLEKQMGRRALSTPEFPTCKILWRRKDDQSFLQDGPQHSTNDKSFDLTPSLHLYLPSSYQPEEKGEDLVEKQHNSSDVHERQAIVARVREHDITTQSQNQDVTVNKINEERQDDFTDGIQYDITDARWHDIPAGKIQNYMIDAGQDIPKENIENDITERKKSHSITDDNRQHEITEDGITQENQCDIIDIEESYNVTEDRQQNDHSEKSDGKNDVYRRTRSTVHNRTAYLRVNKTSDGKLVGKTRYPATATALTFPYSLTDRNPSPTVSVLPSFYGTPFGYRIRRFSTSEPCSSKTRTRKVYNDIRFTRPMNDMRHATETKENPCLLQTKAGAVISPRPKIMSTERGAPPHKIKTTKTFLWGPEGPQETKTVYELQRHVNRWRHSD